MTSDEGRWRRLTAWMQERSQGAGRGLFATQDIELVKKKLIIKQPGCTILTIPAVTLLHPRNIERADNDARAANGMTPLSVPYRMLPYATVNKRPRSTTTKQPPPHDRDYQDWERMNDLAEHYLPKTAYDKLQGVYERYNRHAAMLRKGVPMVLQEEPDERLERIWSQVTEEDLLWGWLNVNTRTLYLQLDMPPIPNTAYADRSATGARATTESDSEQQNHSMAPMLDLANHSHLHMENGSTEAEQSAGASRSKLCAVHLIEESATTSSKSRTNSDAPLGWRKRTFEVCAPKNAKVKKGDEIVFAYGPHSDETLFAEYGFVPLEGENPWNEVLLDDLIGLAWRKRESSTMVALKNEVLEMNGYLKSVHSL
ncbi:hypothetical protein QFC22_002334 [Naganishia vaughanmartiniae]|uniref:Uncharacterized protein n=1 Tax=Naganishia vaughanmartiniae TaxID=1424756 RepID=A0ACC2XE67_9TREE|nr:hypothetical protein QFC22_002334 [Naganishia vaughanmartiniae]